MWKRLFDQLMAGGCYEGRELVRPTERQIDVALDRAERELSIRFPIAYRNFIHQFGPGEIGGYFRIFGPQIPGFGNCGTDIVKANRNWRGPRSVWSQYGKPELVARLVCFSTTIGGDACWWDPKDVQDSRKREWAVYVLSRGSIELEVKLAAKSFKQFIDNHCLGNDFVKIIGGHGWENAPEERPPQEFIPAWRTRKVKRKASGK